MAVEPLDTSKEQNIYPQMNTDILKLKTLSSMDVVFVVRSYADKYSLCGQSVIIGLSTVFFGKTHYY